MHTLQRREIMLGAHTLFYTVFYFSFIRDLIYLVTGNITFLRLMLKGEKKNLLVIIEVNTPCAVILLISVYHSADTALFNNCCYSTPAWLHSKCQICMPSTTTPSFTSQL